jgi:hypothetical protein
VSLPYEIVILDVGGANLVLPFTRSGQADPEQLGGISRAAGGNQYTSLIAEYMVVPLVSAPVPSATFAQVKAMFALGAQINCQGGAAGNVFEGYPGVVKCSGKVTGEIVPGTTDGTGRPLWIINLTLTEVGTAFGGVSATTLFLLTSVDSPDTTDPDTYVSTPAGSYPGDASDELHTPRRNEPVSGRLAQSVDAGYRLVERAGERGDRVRHAVGAPRDADERRLLGVERVGDHGHDGEDLPGPRRRRGRLRHHRGTVVHELRGRLARRRRTATLASTASVNLVLAQDDRFLVEIYPQLQLQAGQADNGQRQVISTGTVPGPRPLPVLGIGGLITAA